MNKELFSYALNYLPDDIIEEAAEVRQKRDTPRSSKKFALHRTLTPLFAAATVVICLGLTVSLAWQFNIRRDTAAELAPSEVIADNSITEAGSDIMADIADEAADDMENSGDIISETAAFDKAELEDAYYHAQSSPTPGVTLQKIDIYDAASFGNIEDSIGVFMYEGRVYTQYMQEITNDSILSKSIGKVTNRFAEGYSESSSSPLTDGNINAEIYTLNYLSPNFALGAKSENGSLFLYFNTSDITLRRGGDIYKDRLNLREYTEGAAVVINDLLAPISEEGIHALKSLFDAADNEKPLYLNSLDPDRILNSVTVNFTLPGRLEVQVQIIDGGYLRLDIGYFSNVLIPMGEEAYENFINSVKIKS